MNTGNHDHGLSTSMFGTGGFVHQTQSAKSIWDNANILSKSTDRLIMNVNLRENENMETLYQVSVVAKTKEIILDKESVVAADQENAKFLVGLYRILADRNLTPADVTVIVTVIGQVKVEKESKQ